MIYQSASFTPRQKRDFKTTQKSCGHLQTIIYVQRMEAESSVSPLSLFHKFWLTSCDLLSASIIPEFSGISQKISQKWSGKNAWAQECPNCKSGSGNRISQILYTLSNCLVCLWRHKTISRPKVRVQLAVQGCFPPLKVLPKRV